MNCARQHTPSSSPMRERRRRVVGAAGAGAGAGGVWVVIGRPTPEGVVVAHWRFDV